MMNYNIFIYSWLGARSARFYRQQVLLKEIRALKADVLCCVEMDAFPEHLSR